MTRNIGMVKWFNNKTGYGFISFNNEDIFVHHQQLSVAQNQYKYLVQGEYVEFEIKSLTEGRHKTMASDVTGVFRGPLLCETRQKMREAHDE